MVIAAGSVIKDPAKGVTVSTTIQRAAGLPPNQPATAFNSRRAASTTGRVEAMAITIKTNSGSKNLKGPVNSRPATAAV